MIRVGGYAFSDDVAGQAQLDGDVGVIKLLLQAGIKAAHVT